MYKKRPIWRCEYKELLKYFEAVSLRDFKQQQIVVFMDLPIFTVSGYGTLQWANLWIEEVNIISYKIIGACLGLLDHVGSYLFIISFWNHEQYTQI